ncbi:transketolase [Vagococcus sp.]|uniref:transketolase n=1 Tax=Vagococcus sp. TaxID=1933889 RepID=UPI003F949C2D
MTVDTKQLEKKAIELRKRLFTLIHDTRTGHTGGSLSSADILTALYYHVMTVDVENPENDARDRYVQSKGHAVEILWTVLADKGFITDEELNTFSQYKSRLIGHPNNEVPGIEMNTGSLGHGLSIASGMALAAKMDNKEYQTYTLMGDGELGEGSLWEAAMFAPHKKLDNLTAIIDNNGLQITGKTSDVLNTEPLKEKWEAFGWFVIEVDGHNMEELLAAFDQKDEQQRPKMIIAHTVKGKGVSFAENQAGWHHRVPTEAEYEQAIEEFDKKLEVL